MLRNSQNTWTKEQLLDLYKYKHEEGKDIKQIAQLMGKSETSIEKKYKRVDWDSFTEDPEGYLSGSGATRKWTQVEMAQLYAFLQSGKSYSYIAGELKRTYISVERKAQTTNWQAWKAAVGDPSAPSTPENIEDQETITDQLATALVFLSRHDRDRLNSINEKEFQRKVNVEGGSLPIPFSDIKKAACNQLDSLGFGNPEMLDFGKGTYIIVGDSHGKFTKTQMFKLLKEVETYLNPVKIIHIGHLLDDDNDISYNWGMFKNLIVIAKIEELKLIQDQRNKYNFNYTIVRGGVQLGDGLIVMNQDIISDYVKTSLGNLDSKIFDERVIVNCHRMEWIPKCSGEEQSYIASPGAICERHIVRAIKQIDFEDGKTVKQAFYGGFSKYRRMQHMYDYWDQGMMVVNVDESGSHTIVPCLIRKIGNIYATSYFDKIITSHGIKEPTKKIFVTADVHAPNQDNFALDIQEQICKDYSPDVLVNLGDAHDYRALNHHEMDRGIPISSDILDESAQVHFVLKKMASWAKEKYLIYGNHERFAMDFVAKFPQFGKYLDFNFICGLEELGYRMTDLKDVLKIGSSKFIHGDITMYGATGNKIEKVARTFGENVFVGHVHYPSIRFGGYAIGLSGKLDQEYNEPTASTWIHGFGLCNHYAGHSWPTTIAIVQNKCVLSGKAYVPKNPSSWVLQKYKARLVYDV